RRFNSLGAAQASFAELIRHAPTSRAEASARMSDNPERSRWMGLRARRNHRYGKSSVHDGLPLSNRRYAPDSIHPKCCSTRMAAQPLSLRTLVVVLAGLTTVVGI